MAKRALLAGHGIVRNSIRKDILQFAIPAIIIFYIELRFCGDSLSGFWGTIWGLVNQPQNLSMFPVQSIIGLALFIIGLTIMIVGQITLWQNYSGTVVIREDHQLITRGIYHFTRHPIYLGTLMACIGLPMYASSLSGILIMSALIPVFLLRIKIEERLLIEEFGDAYRAYQGATRK